MPWTTADIPSQRERLAIVTGTGGLGYETALALAAAGANVVLAGRNAAKGGQAVEAIVARHPRAQVRFEQLDLADLSSVAAFGKRMIASAGRLDLLVNNAGLMNLPTRQRTADGFELQFGTNYLGHFALTGTLLPLLRKAPAPRVVSLSSLYHRAGIIDFDDLQGERPYRPQKAYAQSKLAMLMFALELQRRADRAGWRLISNAAHPGYARTDLITNGPGDSFVTFLGNVLMRPWASQSAADGALPTLFAATAPDAAGGAYYGPTKLWELKGPPGPAHISPKAQDQDVARRLWSVSEALTRVTFDFTAPA